MGNIIFHIDVNSAFLSWSAVWNLQHGSEIDLRKIPSIVGGDPENRHGIVLAKSTPAKKFGIVTGETLFSALAKCPSLTIIKPRYSLYVEASHAMVKLLEKYSPIIERYSIDECFLDMGEISREYALKLAHEIKDRINRELGFTVNIGIGNNKLCAKMASDFTKPDRVHTLYPEEISKKMWPLPVEDLFMVGAKFSRKLRNINLRTIGDVASANPEFLYERFMKYGMMLYNFANGIDSSPVHREGSIEAKGIGNSTTLPFDLTEKISCYNTIASLLETTHKRLREAGKLTSCISVYYTDSKFITKRRQRTLHSPTDSFDFIKQNCIQLFDEIYTGESVRKIGISLTSLSGNEIRQLSFMDIEKTEKEEAVTKVIDDIREKFGAESLIKANHLSSEVDSYLGGVNDGDYVYMKGNL